MSAVQCVCKCIFILHIKAYGVKILFWSLLQAMFIINGARLDRYLADHTASNLWNTAADKGVLTCSGRIIDWPDHSYPQTLWESTLLQIQIMIFS